MRTRYKRWGLLSVLIVILVAVILAGRSKPSATASAIELTFVGYTNLPDNSLRFAIFSVSNQTAYAVRWRGDWVEVEGSPYRKACGSLQRRVASRWRPLSDCVSDVAGQSADLRLAASVRVD